MIDLEARKKRLAEATPGPWEWYTNNEIESTAPNIGYIDKIVFEIDRDSCGYQCCGGHGLTWANGANDRALIVALRNEEAETIAEIEELRETQRDANEFRDLVSRGLDLVALGRRLEKKAACGTLALWAEDHYESRLEEWIKDASARVGDGEAPAGAKEGE